MSVRTVSVKLMADVQGYVGNMRRASETTKSFGRQLNDAASTGKLDAIADRAGVMGAALGGAAAYAVKQFMDFDKQMSAVQAATKASAGDMDKLRAAAMKAGADTKYSATEAAKGIEELAKAGVSTKDILEGGLSGALSLAAAGEIDVGEAAELAASAMTQFKLKGQDLPHVADLLAAGAGKAQGSVKDMGQALNQAGLIAASTGLSIEDTTGTLAAFANAGLLGSDAGTSFKTMLQALQAPSGKTKELMNELGISAYDAQGQFVGITKFADQLRSALFKLTPEMRANAMAQIFGSDATRAATILYEQGAAGLQTWIDKTNDSGFAAETAAIKTDNLRGDLERLKGSVDSLLIGAGSGTNGGLRSFVQILENLVDGFAKLPSGVSTSMVIFAALTGVVLLGLAAWIKARAAITETRSELDKMGPAGERASRGLGMVASAAGKALGVLAALQIVGAIAEQFGKASTNVDLLSASLGDLAKTGEVSGEVSKVFGKNMENLTETFGVAEAGAKGFYGGLNDVISAIPGLNSLADSLIENILGMSFNSAEEDIKALDASMVLYMQTTKDAEKSGALWNAVLLKSGLDTAEFAQKLPGAAKEMGLLQVESMRAKDAQAGLGVSMETAKAAAEGQTEAIAELQKAIREQTDPVFALRNAEDKLAEAQTAAAKATKTHGANSVEAQKATRELASAALDLSGKTAALGSSFSGKLTPEMIATYKAAGLTEPQIRAVGAEFAAAKKKGDAYAKKYGANVALSGGPAVNNALDDLLIKQRALQQGLSYSSAKAAQQKDADRNRQRAYATGGWTGPGSKYEEAGIVHADEFVVRKESRGALEEQNPGALEYMNRTGRWPGYADGGRVRWPFPVTASKAKIPSEAEVLAKVAAMVPSGRTSDWIVQVARALVPGIRVLSKDRPGARTLSGNTSYHSLGRAVDFEPSEKLARLWNERYAGRTKELISPYQRYNLHNGKRHQYTGAVWNQHNFAGGNAHDHIAMAGGGVIREPILGVGASGKTYSFGEGYRPETVTPGVWGAESSGQGATKVVNHHWTINVPPTANKAEVGREVVAVIQAYERGSGPSWRN